jgi:hypothetical protein
MNEKLDPRTRLLAEAFNDEWATGPASVFARRAAAHARRRRTLKQALLIGSATTAGLVTLFFATRPRLSLPVLPAVSSLAQSAPGTKVAPAFEIISDEQLIAELRGRPLLILPQEREGHRIVLLGP